MEENIGTAFLLTILAGLSTGIGSLIVFFIKGRSEKILAFSMSFAAGVMLYVSFSEIFPEAIHILTEHSENNEKEGLIKAVVAFFAGIFMIITIDKFVPDYTKKINLQEDSKLLRIGLVTALAMALHNFPEGIATFFATLEDPSLGLSIAIAIAIHNIPEGIAVGLPIYYATKNRKLAFIFSFLSGVVEPLGALVAYFAILSFSPEYFLGYPLALVSGIMVFISIDQLIPAANRYDDKKSSIYGLVSGMAVMAISIILLK